ncbi:gamma-glutamyl-gamma-aminobutyrate hydrolase family protein [Geochorda subterranea]|uniref:Gamma-glutamyl-gamma-aminobutyrate hydrolase family protein n=1 Tax=Geochorda subterranea TaxID=3109564 RepID=A0ABZ1BP85_9FIRM|nr:gamma-glutamyl-gamma-aminobutyrate hydrolase family protein [Limnochorda sp. LNt]WRP13912.1 gamma-glutamyl-gamma-aminobutyrate hydrolase family protein [Limnochorda sp. LNt]
MEPAEGQRPLIGIVSGQERDREGAARLVLPRAYASAVEMAGGAPVLIPLVEDTRLAESYLEALDGLLLAGGGDVDPARFGEDPSPHLGSVDPERDALELALARRALELDLPILGICRGMQVLNVAAGGSLYQDIGAQVPHPLQHRQSAPRWYPIHEVRLEPESLVGRILQVESVRVNSFHHQAVRTVAPPFRVAAKSKDAVVEAVESRAHAFAVGVQWHPECMVERYPVQRLLFTAFVKAARGARVRRAAPAETVRAATAPAARG